MTDPSPVQLALQRFLRAQEEIKDTFKRGDKPSRKIQNQMSLKLRMNFTSKSSQEDPR